MQGGFGYLGTSLERRDRSRVETLVNVDVEPVWIFTRDRKIDSLNQMQGLRAEDCFTALATSLPCGAGCGAGSV